MRAAFVLLTLTLGACSQQPPSAVFKRGIFCGFDNAGSLMIEPAINASIAIPSEARNPSGFDIGGTIIGDKFTGKVSKLRGASSDVLIGEEVVGSYDQASESLSFQLKYDNLDFTVWPKLDPPDAENSRAFAAGEPKVGETVHYFTGSCGMS